MSTLLQLVEPGSQDRRSSLQGPAIGIDLGTTHSLVAVMKEGGPVILPNEDGEILLPSIVSYSHQKPKVGGSALKDLPNNTVDVIRSIKRLMGKNIQDVSLQESSFYKIESKESDHIIKIYAGNTLVTPIEVSAEILKVLKKQAEFHLDQPVHQAVITVPAYFDEAARTATRDAARLAGLEVLRLLNEPTAAALAYGLGAQKEGIYAIYDLGGGTFDISILRLEKGIFQVLATGGDTALGGDDFDHLIAEHFLKSQSFYKARKLKEALTQEHEVKTSDGIVISRTQFNQLIKPFVDRTLIICQQAVDDADVSMDRIKGVVLVGGSTRVPYIQQRIEDFFCQKPLTTIDPDCAVAYGAALQAHALTQGSQTLLLDVTPLSLGLETMGGLVEKIIHRNTPIPVSKSQEFTTYQDGQAAMAIHVVQGEREMVDQNRSLARFELHGIPPKVAGSARINITFTIDADGLLTVSAKETTTEIEQHVHVKPSYGLNEHELESMLRASYEHVQEDMEQRLLQEAIIDAKRLVQAIESALQEDKSLISIEDFEKIERNLTVLRENIALQNRDAIKQSSEELEKSTLPFAELRMNKAINLALTGQDIDSVLKTG